MLATAYRRSGVFLFASTALVFLLAACGSSGGQQPVTGLVTDVESSSLTVIEKLILVDENGKEWVFEGRGVFAGFTPGHVKEHQALASPVRVEYEERDGVLVIVAISDG